MKNLLYTFILSAIILLVSCGKEPSLDTARWKDIPVIYGVINLKDSVQYLRINRVFTAPESAPYPYMQVNDSVNYPHERFQAYLEEYRDGVRIGDSISYIPVDREKIPGLFSGETNCVYQVRTQINAGSIYKLRVTDLESGKESRAEAAVMGNINIQEAFEWERDYYRVNYVAENLIYDGSLDPYDHENYIVRFLYWETMDGVKTCKYVDWVPTFDPLKIGFDDDTTSQLFDKYFKYLSEQIPIDAAVKRQARGVDYMLALPGKELENYIAVTSMPTNPHFYPDYTNIINGQGVFGSKYFYTYFGLKLRKKTIDTISWGQHLANHRFADSNGEWH